MSEPQSPQSPSHPPPGPDDLEEAAAGRAPAAGRSRRAGPASRRFPLIVPALSVALVAALGLAGALGLQVRGDSRDDDARRGALTAANSYAVDLTTYNHTQLEADFAKVLGNATGTFRSEYTAASASLRDLIAKFKATATGTVLETAWVSGDSSRSTVLLFVDQTVSNANSKTPRVDRSRMKMGLEKQGGRWLISSLDLL